MLPAAGNMSTRDAQLVMQEMPSFLVAQLLVPRCHGLTALGSIRINQGAKAETGQSL